MNLIAQLEDHCLRFDLDRQLPKDFQTGPFGVFEAKKNVFSSHSLEQSAKGKVAAESPAEETIGNDSHVVVNSDAGMTGSVDLDSIMAIPQGPPSNESSVEEIACRSDDDMYGVPHGSGPGAMCPMPCNDFWQVGDLFTSGAKMPMDILDSDFTNLDFLAEVPSLSDMDDFAGLYDHGRLSPKSPTPALLPGPN